MSATDSIPYDFCHCGCGQKTRLAPADDKRHGHVKGEPVRFLRGHQFRGERIAVRYIEEDRGYTTPCWIWQLWTDEKGYGRSGPDTAHHAMWKRMRGPVPKGYHVDHLCRVPSCVNPNHLEPVPHAENIRRGAGAKLTMAQAEEIRRIYKAGGISQRALGARYGVSDNRVGQIVRGQAWTIA